MFGLMGVARMSGQPGGAFSPLSLFANGEQGLWYDPSDFSTMFQDSAGTTPVTAVEQPVGLILDKRLGMALGAEKVPSPLDGIGSASFTIGTSTITRSGSTGTATLFCSAPNLVEGRTYLITYTVSGHSGDSWGVRCANSTAYGPFTGDGTFSLRAVAGASVATTIKFIPWAGAAGTATFSNISVRELPGNHATQPTAAARPVVSARVNLHTQTEVMTAANGWIAGGSVVVSDPDVPPGSAATASSKITADNQFEGPYQTTLPVGVTCTKSVWLRGEVGGEVVGISDNGNTGGTVTVTAEWAQYTRTWTTLYSASSILISSAGGGVVYAADVQFELGTTATRYQRVTTASDYDTVGFPLYLSHDGIDDSLSTTFPDLGTDVTIARAVPMVGASILTAQTIGAGTWTDSANHAGLVIINRALTAGETAALTAYLDAKAGV